MIGDHKNNGKVSSYKWKLIYRMQTKSLFDPLNVQLTPSLAFPLHLSLRQKFSGQNPYGSVSYRKKGIDFFVSRISMLFFH